MQALTQEVTARQQQYDKVNGDGQNLLQLAHPAAVPVLQGKLQHLGRKWVDLRGRMGESRETTRTRLSSQYSARHDVEWPRCLSQLTSINSNPILVFRSCFCS